MKKRLLRESFYALVLIGIARLISLIKEISVANILGLGEDLDHFVYTFLVINFLARFLFSTLSIALVPELTKQLKHSQEAANELFNRVLLVGTSLAVGLFIVWFLCDDLILSLLLGDSQAIDIDKIRRYILYFFPFILLYFLVYSVGQHLNVLGKKIFLAWHMVPSLILVIVFLAVNLFVDPVISLICGYIFGLILTLFICCIALYNKGWRPKKFAKSEANRIVLGQWRILILAELLVAVNLVIDQTMAATYPTGSLSGLDYGLKLFINICVLFYMLINLSYFPYFSKLISTDKFVELKKSMNFILSRLAVILCLASVVFILFDKEIVKLLFERGKFQESDTQLVCIMMTAYMIGLFFNVGNFLFIRLLTALQQVRSVLYLSLMSVFLNVALNVIFSHFYGLVGLAYATSLVSIVAFVFLSFISYRSMNTMINQK